MIQSHAADRQYGVSLSLGKTLCAIHTAWKQNN